LADRRSGLPRNPEAEPVGPPDHAVFYYDFASPDAYLAAERVLHVLPEVAEWIPVRLGGLAARGVGAFRCAEEEVIYREDVEARAHAQGLQPVRWPEPFPADTEWALLVATYAKQIGRAVAFSLAAFRQAFAGGRDLGERDTVLIAAAACEMHPAAVAKGAALRSIAGRLDEATARAAAAGVLDVPAVVAGGHVFHGDRELDAAAGLLSR
jgi:2-hydroxychromene-2-carboxylate isomerase